jgi:hypothetical protein
VREGELERDTLRGQRLAGRYLLDELESRDGIALLYRARDERLDRPVTVRILAAPHADDPAAVARFHEEARAAASSSGPSAAIVYDSGEHGGLPFIVLGPQPEPRRPEAALGSVDADDTTTVISVGATPPGSPAAPTHTSARPPLLRGPAVAGDRQDARWRPAVLAALLAVAAVGGVVAVLALGGLGGERSPADAAGPTPSERATPAVPAGKVRVPDTIGMTEGEAEAAARASGLAWRLEWRVDPSKTPGVYDQQPAAGTLVEEGAPFVMYAYRTR